MSFQCCLMLFISVNIWEARVQQQQNFFCLKEKLKLEKLNHSDKVSFYFKTITLMHCTMWRQPFIVQICLPQPPSIHSCLSCTGSHGAGAYPSTHWSRQPAWLPVYSINKCGLWSHSLISSVPPHHKHSLWTSNDQNTWRSQTFVPCESVTFNDTNRPDKSWC